MHHPCMAASLPSLAQPCPSELHALFPEGASRTRVVPLPARPPQRIALEMLSQQLRLFGGWVTATITSARYARRKLAHE